MKIELGQLQDLYCSPGGGERVRTGFGRRKGEREGIGVRIILKWILKT